MPRANPLQAAFNAGELGPRMAGRVDFAKYRSAGARVENMTPLPQGGLTRRPGTRFVAAAANPDKRPRLIPFEFSTEQAYVIEGGDGQFHFFRNKGQIIVPATDAAISNGTFDSNINDWDDLSTGAALIDHVLLGGDEADLLRLARIDQNAWGDLTANVRHIGLRFTVGLSGNVREASIDVSLVTTPFDAVALI